jgi:hypothetical protein|tara:strand:- start:552 stop:764 length:213 start_codon:yes stop_codon:yes gene_type:complete
MDARRIDHLLGMGYWIQVSPLANAGSGWICGIYKRGVKSGNWITESTKQKLTPHECYDWADEEIHRLLSK